LAVVGSFGEKLSSCRVDEFRPADVDRPDLDYRDRFIGLSAQGLPSGAYDVSVACLEGTPKAQLEVDDFNRFGLVVQNRRSTRSDHVVPRLAISMIGGVHDEETWWVTLTSEFGNVSYKDEFRGAEATARVFDPDPGGYLVAVRSTGGYACVQEIDLIEITRLWSFDPRNCRFIVDGFAHVVTAADRTSGKRLGWYRDMRLSEEELFRELKGAATTDAKPAAQPVP